MRIAIKDVDHYISIQPATIRGKLIKLREVIKLAAPNAIEEISYNMPAYKLNGRLLYFAANKHHIGLYALTNAIKAYQDELSNYVTAKSTIQFPYHNPIPYGLIKKMIQFSVKDKIERKAKVDASKIK